MTSEIFLAPLFKNAKTAFDIGKTIAQFLGIIESVDTKLDKLIKSDYLAAIEILNQAIFSSNYEEQKISFRDAKNLFSKAINLVEYDKLVTSYLGLAICHHYLNDLANTKRALTKLSKLVISIPFEQVGKEFLDFTDTNKGDYKLQMSYTWKLLVKTFTLKDSHMSEEYTQLNIDYNNAWGYVNRVAFYEKHLKLLQIIKQAGECASTLKI